MQAEILLTMKLKQQIFADPRRIALLKQIRQSGSISQGARLAGMSYKSAWDAINDMNQLAEQTLVERVTGGKGGGGAQITDYGNRLIKLYELLAQVQQKAFDILQDDTLPLESLLAAVSRFSLQTSARNQLFATVVKRHDGQVQQHIDVQLTDGKTRLKAAVTAHSAERLALDEGREVLVLIKAPWIALASGSAPPPQSDNQLRGVISTIEQGAGQSEVQIRLPDGQILCATVENSIIQQQQLEEETEVTAYFSAERVILATLL